MRFSLILGTIERTGYLARSLASLDAQTHRDFELIVVDQNPDDRLAPILTPYKDRFPIVHLRSEKGLSRAKNLGLKHASNEIIGFPDDDCQFLPDTLERVALFFADHPRIDGLTGRSMDENGRESNGRFDSEPGLIDRFNVWNRGIAYNIFLRQESVKGAWFDEELGPGAGTPWGAADETDYLLRMLARGASLHYDPNLVVIHPPPVPPYDAKAFRRAYGYGCGLGYVLRRHDYPLWFKAGWLIRPLGGAVSSLIGSRRTQARYQWNTCKGRFRGLVAWDPA